MSVADTTCFASLPLQFNFKESPGILLVLASHFRGLHLNEYVWALHTSASDGSTTRQSTWKWESMALFRRSAPRDSLAHNPNVSKVREVYVTLLREQEDEIARKISTHGQIERRNWTAAARAVNQSSSTWKHNRTISKTIDCITGALHASVHRTSKHTGDIFEMFRSTLVSIWNRRKDAALHSGKKTEF